MKDKYIKVDPKDLTSLDPSNYGELGFIIMPINGKHTLIYLPSSKTELRRVNHEEELPLFINNYLKKPKNKYYNKLKKKLVNLSTLRSEFGFVGSDELLDAIFISSLGYLVVLNKSDEYNKSAFIFEPYIMNKIYRNKKEEIINTIVSLDKNDINKDISYVIKVPEMAYMLTHDDFNIEFTDLNEYNKQRKIP